MPSISDAIKDIGKNGEGLDVGVKDGKDSAPTIEASGSKNLGKGWSVGGAVDWAASTWSAYGGFSWRPKSK